MEKIIVTAVVVVGIALTLGSIKVDNELKMTKMYERQAVALERLADAFDRHAEAALARAVR